MAGIKIEGLEELEAALKENVKLEDVKRVVRHHGSQLQRNMQNKADFRMGYQTGQTKRSIGLEITNGGFEADVGPETDYSMYLEYGTRFMEAQPFVRPAFEEQSQKFARDMKKLMK